MRISVITIGDELLKGSTVNTNSAWLGECLLEIGVIPERNLVVPDSQASISEALDFVTPLSDVIITSGGLGPTGDDITRNTLTEYFKLKLESNKDIVKQLEKRWACLKKEHPPEKVLEQALVPKNGEAFVNEVGTAPGIWIEVADGKYLCMLPGPPMEQRPMVQKQLIPKLKDVLKTPIISKVYYVAHAAESKVEEEVKKIIEGTDIKPAYCASYDHVRLFLTGSDAKQFKKVCKAVEKTFGYQLLEEGCTCMVEDVLLKLREHCLTLGTAESCTGGMLAEEITAIPGASEIFAGSIVAYCNDIKTRTLNVPKEIIEAYGSVSEQCVSLMVENLCAKMITTSGIAVSGIAGPGGGTPEKPVGLVCIAVKVNGHQKVIRCNFPGNREAVRRRAIAEALYTLREMLKQD